MTKLRDAIRVCITELRTRGRGTTRWIAQTMLERHPELIEEAKIQLFVESIAKTARQMMKNGQGIEELPTIALPAELAFLANAPVKLPTMVCTPPSGDEKDHIWVALCDATIDELERHIVMLRIAMNADSRGMKMLMTLHDYLRSRANEEQRDQAIGQILKVIVEQEKKVG